MVDRVQDTPLCGRLGLSKRFALRYLKGYQKEVWKETYTKMYLFILVGENRLKFYDKYSTEYYIRFFHSLK